MLIVDIKKVIDINAGDGTYIKELISPNRDKVKAGYSLALATVPMGQSSIPHKLKSSSEIYIIIEGTGLMHIAEEVMEITKGQIVYIPPGSFQYIENAGSGDLVFYCIVDPPWRQEDDEVLV
jgi:mannose-6-phosphate isomerase-like protein (cupin superfamily)